MNLKILRNFLSRSYSMYRSNENKTSPSNIFKLNHDFDVCIRAATKHIESGNVIAIPTDTIYGLAADAQNNDAIQKLYKIKGRVFSKPLAICVCNVKSIGKWGHIDHLPSEILTKLLPGPVTVILNRTANLNSALNPNVKKVGVRIPKNKFVQQLTSCLETPIALTSANKSHEMSSISVEEFSILWSELDAIFDGGRIGEVRSGSTIVDLSESGIYEIVRNGSYLNETLKILHDFDIFEK